MDINCSCQRGLLFTLRRDWGRYVFSAVGDSRLTPTVLMEMMFYFPSLWVVVLYRLNHHLNFCVRPHVLGRLLAVPVFIVSRVYGMLIGVTIQPAAHVGPGLFINHFSGIFIGPVRIGENCDIFQGVTLGHSTRRHAGELGGPDTPTLGNRVWIGPGAVAAGPVFIGDDAVVAANSLVTRDVPPRGVAIGVPARVVSAKGSFRQVSYRGMDDDPQRAASMMAAASEPPVTDRLLSGGPA
jgi:serine O-acetyltransferase